MKRLTFPYEKKLTEHTATIRYGSQAMRRDLVERLAQYENLGYDPEDLKMILDMIIPGMMLESARRIKAEQEKKDERT